MAFFSKAGNILRHAVRKQYINQEIYASNPSNFQEIRCMSFKLFVSGMSQNTNDVRLTEVFSEFGEDVKAKVVYDPNSGKSKGYGFVIFEDADNADAAMQAWDYGQLDGRRIRVNLSVGGGYGAGCHDGGADYGSGGNYDAGSNIFASRFDDSDQFGNDATGNHAESGDFNSPFDAADNYRDDNAEPKNYASRSA